MPNSYYRPVLLWLHIIATVSSKRLLLACLPWPLPQLVTSQALLSRPLLSQPQLVTPQELSSCPPFIPSTFGYITSTAALPSFPSQPRVGYISASSSHCCPALLSITASVGYISASSSHCCPALLSITASVGYISASSSHCCPALLSITASVGYISASSSHCCYAFPLSQPHGLGHSQPQLQEATTCPP